MNTIEDDDLGLLQWDSELQQWQGATTFPTLGEVGVGLPPEYVNLDETRSHILKMMPVIERDELAYREKAAQELSSQGGYRLFLEDDQAFDLDRFVQDMHLAYISFEPEFPNEGLILAYEYGEGMEHGITIVFTWDGIYRYAQAG